MTTRWLANGVIFLALEAGTALRREDVERLAEQLRTLERVDDP